MICRNGLCTTDKSDSSLCVIYHNISWGTGPSADALEALGEPLWHPYKSAEVIVNQPLYTWPLELARGQDLVLSSQELFLKSQMLHLKSLG